MDNDLNQFVKAMKSPQERRGILAKARSICYTARWRFKDSIWYVYAPDWMIHLTRNLGEFWYKQVSCRIFPRQRWLTKQIPRTWVDNDHLLETVLYASIIHFVDESGEDCFGQTVIEGDFAKQLREVYDWAKTGRPAAAKEIEDAMPEFSAYVFTNKGIEMTDSGRLAYDKVTELERRFEENDDKCLEWIVKWRKSLWT